MTDDQNLFTTTGGADPPGLPVEPLDPVLLADVLDALTTRQHALERAFDALNRRVGAPTKEGPWTWRALGPTQTRTLFGELRDWVDWLTVRYQLRGEAHTIAACWYRHPVAVEELTALMVAWRGAYLLDQAPPGDTLINWHDRWLWPTLHRLNTQLRVWAKCTAGVHQASPSTSPPTDGDDFAGFLEQITAPAGTRRPAVRSPASRSTPCSRAAKQCRCCPPTRPAPSATTAPGTPSPSGSRRTHGNPCNPKTPRRLMRCCAAGLTPSTRSGSP